jgi:hypothetical protein
MSNINVDLNALSGSYWYKIEDHFRGSGLSIIKL